MMAALVSPVCAVLRPGEAGVQLCTADPGHPGPCQFETFSSWLKAVAAQHRPYNLPIPSWITSDLWARVRAYGQQALGTPEQEDESARTGRALDPQWNQIGAEWRAPDDAGRSVAPKAPGRVPHGVYGEPVGTRPTGQREGYGHVETIDDLLAKINGELTAIENWMAAVQATKQLIEENQARIIGLGGQVGSASSASAILNQAMMDCDAVLVSGEAAKEELNNWKGAILSAFGMQG